MKWNSIQRNGIVNKSRPVLLFMFVFSLVLTSCLDRALTPEGQDLEPDPIPTATVKPLLVEMVEIDQEWNQYINRRLGFRILVPKQMHRYDAGCQQVGEGDEAWYIPEEGTVPVVVLEGPDRVIITGETALILSSSKEPTPKVPHPGNDQCQVIPNTFDYEYERDYTSYNWEIIFFEVRNEKDLEVFVDLVYGKCFSVGEITPIEGKDQMKVKIVGDGKPVEESTCLMRGGYVFRYSLTYQRAATWYTGQTIHFEKPGGGEIPFYDGDMSGSFEFIPKISQ